jgi:glycosyltransferase involved in cell wall biosynthesis
MRIIFLEAKIYCYRVPFLVELMRHGEIGVVTAQFEDGARAALEGAGVTCDLLPSISIGRTWRHPQGFSEPNPITIVRGVLRRLDRMQPDVIIAGELGTRVVQALLYSVLQRPRDRPRVIAWARMSEQSERGRSLLQQTLRPWLLRAADGVITNGQSGVRYLEGLGTDSLKIHRIPQATDPRVVGVPGAGTHSPLRLLFVGRLVSLKGIDLLIQEMARSSRSRAVLRVVGAGPRRQSLQEEAERLGVAVEFTGFCQGAELAAQYAAADYLVFPSLSDEWGLVVNEALASGLPVVGSVYSQAVNELIRDGANGWLFRPDCPGQLAGILDSLDTIDAGTRRRMQTSAIASARVASPGRIADLFAEAIVAPSR